MTEPVVANDATLAAPEVTAPEQPAGVANDEPMAEAPVAAEETSIPTVELAKAAEKPAKAAAKPAKAAAKAAEKPGKAAAKPAKAAAEEAATADAAAPAAEAPVATGDAPARAATGPRGLRLRYAKEVVPALVKQFEYANPNQVPKLEKIVVNVGLGEALSNAKAIDAASGDLIMITGQKPIVMKAKRSIAQFRVRTGNPIGLKVTLRGQRMWDFLERLTLLTLPRIRDFRGIPSKSFDGRGNYTLGMREQIAFPEIDYDKVDRLRGLEVSIVTTAKSDEESKRLLELLGMPFGA
jgi:large subunit ribosomal protein L5